MRVIDFLHVQRAFDVTSMTAVAVAPPPTTTTRQVATSVNAAPWSAAYKEDDDNFADFAEYDSGNGASGNGLNLVRGASSSNIGFAVQSSSTGIGERQPSQRQLTGQFEVEGGDDAKLWEADWDDEDADDTFERCMERIQMGK